jgi:two-component system OmpR family sensor kinase
MFERFTQADEGLRRRSRGTGLGLNICETLTAAHGGTLTYRTADGGGACFVLSLPRVSARSD